MSQSDSFIGHTVMKNVASETIQSSMDLFKFEQIMEQLHQANMPDDVNTKIAACENLNQVKVFLYTLVDDAVDQELEDLIEAQLEADM